MNRPFVAASIVALAVLFSQGGGLVLAAVCPHLRSQQPQPGCHAKTQNEHDHEVAAPVGDALQTQAPDMRCNHCAVHSRNKREESALQQTPPQRTGDLKVTTYFPAAGAPVLENVLPVANAHGPPGATAPVNLLLNVFRI